MKSFWTLNTLDKCKALSRLVQMISTAGFSSIEQLAAARGETTEIVWLRCCLEAGVEPCAMPERLFGERRDIPASPKRTETARRDMPQRDMPRIVELPKDTPGAIARAKVLAARERPTRFSFLRDRAVRDSMESMSG